MKYSLLILGLLSLCLAGQGQTCDFNNTSDLTTCFTPGTPQAFVNESSGGIDGTGSVNVLSGDIWTSKTMYDTDTIAVSSFFYNYSNAGYGGLGITTVASNNYNSVAYPSTGLGVVFHGGGGYFINNNVKTTLAWSTDISLSTWYKFVFIMTMNADNTFNLALQIWETDEYGNAIKLFTEQILDNVTNSTVAAAGQVYPYFAASQMRFSHMDNFNVSTIVPVLPVITTEAATDITAISATGNATISDFGSSSVTEHGIVWSTSAGPEIRLSTRTVLGAATATGAFTSSLTGLSPNTLYYMRAYASGEAGIAYGNEESFTTPKLSQTITFGTVADVTYGDADFDPAATASSSLVVSYSSSDESVASIVSGMVHIVGAGTCTIYADQAGDDSYNAATQVSQSLTVGQKELTIINAAANDKEYDGDAAATVTGAALQGVITGDVVSLVTGTASFADKNVGTTKTVTVTGSSLDGADKDNYVLTEISGLTADITAKAITVSADAGQGKTYGDTDPVLTYTSSPSLISGDAFTGLLSRASGETVNTYAIETGTLTAGNNYSISLISADFTISPLQLSISNPDITLAKEYDGTTVAGVTGGTLSGVISSDAGYVSVTAVANYADASVGENKTITVTYSLSGTSSGNYLAPSDFIVTSGVIYEKIVLEAIEAPYGGCEGATIDLSYTITGGDPYEYRIIFDQAAAAAGFTDIDYTTVPASSGTGVIAITVPAEAAYGIYTANLQMRNSYGSESSMFSFTFSINLSSDYLVAKFDDVILCDNSTELFTAYQWYKNDMPLSGATGQYYCDPEGLSGIYYVQVTTTEGEILRTCPATFAYSSLKKSAITVYPNPVRAGQTFTVKITGMDDDELQNAVLHIYNLSGTEVYVNTDVEVVNCLNMNGQNGNYVVRVITKGGKEVKAKMMMMKY